MGAEAVRRKAGRETKESRGEAGANQGKEIGQENCAEFLSFSDLTSQAAPVNALF